MNQQQSKTDWEILAELRKPIDEMVSERYGDKTEYQRLRLKQLAWQTVDVLVRTGNAARLREEKDVERIIRNIKEIGASEEFIQDSLALAVSIYRKMQVDYPELLKRYRGRA